jgi:hypothetical protein
MKSLSIFLIEALILSCTNPKAEILNKRNELINKIDSLKAMLKTNTSDSLVLQLKEYELKYDSLTTELKKY